MSDRLADAEANRLVGEVAALLPTVVRGDLADVGLSRLSGGASRQSWLVEGTLDGQSTRWVLQLDGGLSREHAMTVESRLMTVAKTAGVPVPTVLAASDDAAELGRAYLLTEHVAGQTLGKKVQSDPGLTVARARFATQCGAALGRLHAVPRAEVGEQLWTELTPREDLVGFWRAELDRHDQPHPAFEIALRWLDEHRPAPLSPVLLHGDFRLGNLMVGPGGLTAVLDWELSHIGDPREDLGWLCAPCWRFDRPEPVAGIDGYAGLLDAYAAASGVVVASEDLRWFEVLATLRWGVLCIAQVMRHSTGATPSIELAALGRRVCEMEYDLLKMTA
jgi:aminoglycoside phosphotransferase (APT) family kinase protein